MSVFWSPTAPGRQVPGGTFWWAELNAAFKLLLAPHVGMSAASRSVGKFGLSTAPSIRMNARAISAARFALSTSPRLGFAIPAAVPASLVLPVTPRITMTGRDRERATFKLTAVPQVGMGAKARSAATFNLAVAPNLGFIGAPSHNVSFVSKGGGKSGTSGTALTVSETIAATATANIAVLACSSTNASLTATGKVGSTAMVQLGKIGPITAGSDRLYIFIFGLQAPPTGAQTITVTTSASVNSYGLQSSSYAGVQGFGPAATNSGTSSTATQAVAALDGEMIVHAFINSSSGTFSSYNATTDFSLAGSGFIYPMITGHIAGAPSVAISASESSSSFGSVAVPLL